MKKLLIADDSRLFRNVLERSLSPYYEVVGKATNGDEAFELYNH